jgi:hypothetical protein
LCEYFDFIVEEIVAEGFEHDYSDFLMGFDLITEEIVAEGFEQDFNDFLNTLI